MTDPKELTIEELLEGIRETQRALQRGQELMKRAGAVRTTLGVSKLAESMPKLIQRLEKELAAFKVEIETKLSRQ